jgi:DNA-binding SARP family transcriptional activator
MLLLEPGRAVPVSVLVDRLWGHDPPETASNTVYAYVSRLRKALDPHGVRPVRRGGGYLIDVDPNAVDVHRFRRLASAAAVIEDPTRAAAALDEALGLCRGTPLAGMAGSWFGKVRERLIDERLSALIHRNEMLLRCGRNADIVEPLLTVIEDRPTDERPVAQLMLALYRCGRAAEAQEHYRLIRRRLNDLQGIEPSAVLRRLHERILRDDPGLIDPQRAAAWTPVTPAGLPHDVPGLLGRRSALDKLDEVIGVDPVRAGASWWSTEQPVSVSAHG